MKARRKVGLFNEKIIIIKIFSSS